MAATLGWFAANNGLHELIEVHIRYNAEVYSGVDLLSVRGMAEMTARHLWKGGRRVPPGPFPILLVPIASGAILAWRERNVGLPLLAWAQCGCVRGDSRKGLRLLLVNCVSSDSRARRAGARETGGRGSSRSLIAATAIAVFVAGVGIDPLRDAWHLTRYVAGRDSRDEYLEEFRLRWFYALSGVQAAEYIKARTQPAESAGERSGRGSTLLTKRPCNRVRTAFSIRLPR